MMNASAKTQLFTSFMGVANTDKGIKSCDTAGEKHACNGWDEGSEIGVPWGHNPSLVLEAWCAVYVLTLLFTRNGLCLKGL